MANSGYFPVVLNPEVKLQTLSSQYTTPFFFGGSQVPQTLQLKEGSFSGSGVSKKGRTSLTTKRSPMIKSFPKVKAILGRLK